MKKFMFYFDFLTAAIVTFLFSAGFVYSLWQAYHGALEGSNYSLLLFTPMFLLMTYLWLDLRKRYVEINSMKGGQ